jgi:predicted glycosyltransferase
MLYAIIEKDLGTDICEVHSVYDDKAYADSVMESLIDTFEGYGYKMISVEDNG